MGRAGVESDHRDPGLSAGPLPAVGCLRLLLRSLWVGQELSRTTETLALVRGRYLQWAFLESQQRMRHQEMEKHATVCLHHTPVLYYYYDLNLAPQNNYCINEIMNN